MRIVDRKTFLALPSGTVFMKFPAQPADGSYADLAPDGCLQIKWDTCGEDFVTQDLVPFPDGWQDCKDIFDDMQAMLRGEPGKMADYDCAGRDGLFDKDQFFQVWDIDDHQKLIGLLYKALEYRIAAE